MDSTAGVDKPIDLCSSSESPSTPEQDALQQLLSWLGGAEVVFGLSPPFDLNNGVVIVDLTKEKSRERLVADAPQHQFALYPPKLNKKIGVGFAAVATDLAARFQFRMFHVGKSTMGQLVQHREDVVVGGLSVPSFEVEHIVASQLKELESREKAYADTSGRTHKFRSGFRSAFEGTSAWMRGMVKSKPDFDWMIVSKHAAQHELRSALLLLKKIVGNP